jgi:hypothetical protein
MGDKFRYRGQITDPFAALKAFRGSGKKGAVNRLLRDRRTDGRKEDAEQDDFNKNQQLSTEFDLYLLDHPEISDKIPDGALLVFLPDFDKDLAKKNRKLATKFKEKGQAVVYVKVKGLSSSRLEGLSLEVA